jgi:Protein kinase domain
VVVALLAGTVVAGYEIEGLLGEGGMGRVYAARDVAHGRRVALKLLSPELGADSTFVERFRREGRLQASLDHPHVVTVYEAGEAEQGLYLAMQLIGGPTLAELIHDRVLDTERAMRLLSQVADALDAAHVAGLVHRDVKPQNILVGPNDQAYLGDFGLTRASGAAATSRLLGTVAYLAPEVIRGAAATPAADIYAFAATAFECLTGTVVFPRRTEAAVLHAHTSERPPRPTSRRPELPGDLDGVFEQGLAKEPDRRPASASELIGQIQRSLRRADPAALGPPPPPGALALAGDTADQQWGEQGLPIRRRSRRAVVAWVLGGAAAGAAVATTVALLANGGDRRNTTGLPPPLAAARILGSDLTHPGDTLNCRGRPPQPTSEGCTIRQANLPGRTLVVPADGVIRRWSVRSARGELALVVLRQRESGLGQLARSRDEFVESPGVHTFRTDLPVERGDLIGLVAIPGSAVGARAGVGGASTERWIPRLSGTKRPTLGVHSGFARELLLRVDYLPGTKQQLPHQVSGASAATLAPGPVKMRRRVKFTNGRPVEIRLVQLGRRFALDLLERGQRTARVDVPDFVASTGGRMIDFETYAEEGRPEQLGIYMEWVNEDSARVLNHFYSVFPHEFLFIN